MKISAGGREEGGPWFWFRLSQTREAEPRKDGVASLKRWLS